MRSNSSFFMPKKALVRIMMKANTKIHKPAAIALQQALDDLIEPEHKDKYERGSWLER